MSNLTRHNNHDIATKRMSARAKAEKHWQESNQTAVVDTDKSRIGYVESLLIDYESGKVTYLRICIPSSDSLAADDSVDNTTRLIPWAAFEYFPESNQFILQAHLSTLQAMHDAD